MKPVRFLKSFFFCVALLGSGASADFFDMNGLYGLRYGPNISAMLAGNTPFVWGEWLPQANATASFNWIEPLHDLPYGKPLDPAASFLRFSADAEVSPFYGGFRVGLGARPFQINPQVEVRVLYEHYTYFNSNVEMTIASNQKNGNVADSWNADWITDRVYSPEAAVDFMQNFAFYFDLEYAFGTSGLVGLGVHYTLVDISTQFDGKSYDYRRNIPVFSRDFIIDFLVYSYLPLQKHWAAVGYLNQYNTGKSKSSSGTYLKEPLSYTIALAGPAFNWDDGRSRLTLLVGCWFREKDRFYKGTKSQQLLAHLQYQRNFNIPVGVVPE